MLRLGMKPSGMWNGSASMVSDRPVVAVQLQPRTCSRSAASFILLMACDPVQHGESLQQPIRLDDQRLDIQRHHQPRPGWPSAAQPSAALAMAAASSSLARMGGA
jgi:hypothetical protein